MHDETLTFAMEAPGMQFENERHEASFGKLAAFCTEDKGFAPASGEAPGFVIRDGGTLIVVLALPWGETQSVYQLRALMVRDVPVGLKAAKWLLELNDTVVLGAFGWSDDSGLFFGYTVPADDLTEEALATSIAAVGMTARHYAPEIIDKFGGRLFFAE